MERVRTNDDFLLKVKDLVGDEYTFLEPYRGYNTRIKVRHNTCGTVYLTTPTNFFTGKRCRKCQLKKGDIKRTKTTEEFKHEVYSLVGKEYTVIGEYVKAKNKLSMRHNLCGNVYEVAPCKFLTGRRCPFCAKQKRIEGRTKDTSWFKNKVKNILGPEYLVTGTYKKATVKISIKHLICGRTYYRTPRTIIDVHTGCPYCGCTSTGEKYIRTYLEEREIPYVYQKRFSSLSDTLPLSYDFFLPSQNLLIEYQGIQHYRPKEFFGVDYFKVQRRHDLMKKTFAEDNGYKLLSIPYTANTQKKVNTFMNKSI